MEGAGLPTHRPLRAVFRDNFVPWVVYRQLVPTPFEPALGEAYTDRDSQEHRDLRRHLADSFEPLEERMEELVISRANSDAWRTVCRTLYPCVLRKAKARVCKLTNPGKSQRFIP